MPRRSTAAVCTSRRRRDRPPFCRESAREANCRQSLVIRDPRSCERIFCQHEPMQELRGKVLSSPRGRGSAKPSRYGCVSGHARRGSDMKPRGSPRRRRNSTKRRRSSPTSRRRRTSSRCAATATDVRCGRRPLQQRWGLEGGLCGNARVRLHLDARRQHLGILHAIRVVSSHARGGVPKAT